MAKLYTGKPKDRLFLILPYWSQDDAKQPFRMTLPKRAHAEITRLYGFTLFGWFFGVQRYVARDHINPDMAYPASSGRGDQ